MGVNTYAYMRKPTNTTSHPPTVSKQQTEQYAICKPLCNKTFRTPTAVKSQHSLAVTLLKL